MDDAEVARYWDRNAPDWASAVRAGYDVYRRYVNNPAFFGMLPEAAGLRVLDVGCGEGANTRACADRGARMVGVDVSAEMIAAARRCEDDRPKGIEYHVASGSDLGAFEADSFDAAISTMAMMDAADYAGCVREVARVLRPGGWFQFSITHPCGMTRRWRWISDESGVRVGVLVGDYFGFESDPDAADVDEWFFGGAPSEVRARARRFRIPRFFRTLSEYFNTLVEAGFAVERLREPYASDEAAAQCPAVADTRIAPYFLIFRCRLGEAPGDRVGM